MNSTRGTKKIKLKKKKANARNGKRKTRFPNARYIYVCLSFDIFYLPSQNYDMKNIKIYILFNLTILVNFSIVLIKSIYLYFR